MKEGSDSCHLHLLSGQFRQAQGDSGSRRAPKRDDNHNSSVYPDCISFRSLVYENYVLDGEEFNRHRMYERASASPTWSLIILTPSITSISQVFKLSLFWTCNSNSHLPDAFFECIHQVLKAVENRADWRWP